MAKSQIIKIVLEASTLAAILLVKINLLADEGRVVVENSSQASATPPLSEMAQEGETTDPATESIVNLQLEVAFKPLTTPPF